MFIYRTRESNLNAYYIGRQIETHNKAPWNKFYFIDNTDFGSDIEDLYATQLYAVHAIFMLG